MRLRGLLQQAAMTQEALARGVNALGHERGHRLFYDRTSVAHWLRGARPRPPAPDLITEVLSRRLGRPITVAATGLAAPSDAERDVSHSMDAAERLARLSAWDVAPKYGEDLPGTPYSAVDVQEQPIRERSATPVLFDGPWGQRRVPDDARMMLTCFTTLDAGYGGGYARPALVRYLASDIAIQMKTKVDGPAWKELCATTIRLIALCGTMSMDTRLHHAAQSYYRTALDLAEQSPHSDARALTLHRISIHARFLGQRQEARGLAEAALEATPSHCANTARAQRTAHLAACMADLAEHRGARSQLRRAEGLLSEKSDASGTPEEQAIGQAEMHWRQAEVLGARGASSEAVAAMRKTVGLLPPGHRRARLLARARLAILLIDEGETAQAAEVVSAFLDEAACVHSALVVSAHSDLYARCASLWADSEGAAVRHHMLASRPPWEAEAPDRRWCCLC
ncbi:hypothetical protein ADL21_02250 [Streptomyces albus subsp. albus]|nr:hypothetical protein ADL21_02250 [Streptomyces albus subsp. albus]